MDKDTSGNDYIGTQRKSYITEVNATDFTVNNDGTIDLQDYEYTLKSNGNCAVLLGFYFEDYCGNKTDTKTYSIIKHTEVDLTELKWGNGPAVLTGGKLKFGTDYLDSLNAGMNPVEGATPMGGNSVALSINTIDSSSFSDFLGRGGLDGIKQALFDDNRMFASEVGVW